MKKLFRKEIREETKVAVLGFAVLSLIIIHHCASYIGSLDRISGPDTQPLLSPSLLSTIGCFCSIFGLVLGWLQMRAEKHPDLWAFLVHRPATRTNILCVKLAAGLFLYTLGAGLPLLGLLAFVLTPGRVVAPFAWPMTFPLIAIFLLGVIFYLAGLLTGVRQARWYGSRGFGLGLAFVAGIGVFDGREFWTALLILAITGGILAAAVWGSFETGGFYRRQPAAGRFTLALACAAACTFLVLAATVFLVASLTFGDSPKYSYTNYKMTTNGAIYNFTCRNNNEWEVTDLDHHPVLDPKTGQPIKLQDFQKRSAPMWSVYAGFGRLNKWQDTYMSNLRFYGPWQFVDKIRWYRLRDGSIVGYSITTRREIGALEPPANSSARFILPSDHRPNDFDTGGGKFLASTNTLYRVDLEDRSLNPVFTVANDAIGGYVQTALETDDQLTLQGVIVVTPKTVDFLDFQGRTEWSPPHPPSVSDYPSVIVYALQPRGRFALEFPPDAIANQKAGMKLPVHFEWLTKGQGVTETKDLPEWPRPQIEFLTEKVISLVLPPCLAQAIAYWTDDPKIWNPLCLVTAACCALVGLWLCARYSFAAPAWLGWTIFILLCGLPGLLAFLSVQEWPAREPCPQCKKPRAVDREKCPHCGADFAPPEKNGIEIFETLATR